MTIEKAIEQLKSVIEINERSIKQIKEIGKNTKTLSEIFTEAEQGFLNENMACEIGIQALEKQVPKKIPAVNTPCHVKAFDSDTETVYTYSCVNCPVCSKWIVANVNHKYCQYCGQALDWSDNDE